MAQLIVRNIEKKVVRKLKERAAREGVSMEEQLRRILRQSVQEKATKPKMNLKEYLVALPHVDFDLMKYIPKRGMPRPVNLE
jgi:plasmid stability protein